MFEVGLALDRTFANGLGVELTGTYAAGSEDSGLARLDDLDSYGAGLEFTYADWTLGGSFLQSNNGLQDGDYTAFDAGLTWKPGALGFTLGYGHAEDDNIGLSSDQRHLASPMSLINSPSAQACNMSIERSTASTQLAR